jgi:hypothetical protein
MGAKFFSTCGRRRGNAIGNRPAINFYWASLDVKRIVSKRGYSLLWGCGDIQKKPAEQPISFRIPRGRNARRFGTNRVGTCVKESWLVVRLERLLGSMDRKILVV